MRLINADEHECWACVHHQNESGKCDTWCDAGESFELREDVKNAKTVEVRPVVYGEWIEDTVSVGNPFDPYKEDIMDVIMCSNCKSYYDISERSNFCPNCGADMKRKVQDGRIDWSI